ncbi:MAG TPA: aldo/keto reductase [Actinophytocola sp.]|uniref:aldo/keto reductase n=1 Tax=Actinophytocola sp. TaxID=1872138 RepID=UPI002DBD26C9|nr:aldo/keto reductase [Actinophytocola sp.]HEU5476014.1 aldo/keto reductase [Actinophytocola sp.]
MTESLPAAGAGTVAVGGLRVCRMGYGAMQLTGPGVWGDPPDRSAAVRVLRRAAELGVDFIDTADSYGPYVSEELIREALHPYDKIVIGTKGGFLRTGPGEWTVCGNPAFLRQEVEMSLRRLGLSTIDLYQLHRIDPDVPAEDSLGELALLQREGKIRHIGLSEVNVDEIKAARGVVEIVSVQNLYNLTDRRSEAVLDYCTNEGIAFIPWFPIATGRLARPGGILARLSGEYGATPAQLALAWLLRRSPVMLPIPGTKSVAHLEENVAAAGLTLTDDQYEALTAAG